jgi:hypothetical protein
MNKLIRYSKTEQAPFPLNSKTEITKIIKMEQRQVASVGKMDYVIYVDMGLRGGSLKENDKFVDVSQEQSDVRWAALCQQYEVEGYLK